MTSVVNRSRFLWVVGLGAVVAVSAAPADDTKVIIDRQIRGVGQPESYVADEFIVVLNQDARGVAAVDTDRAGRPVVNLPTLQTVIDGQGVQRLERQFPSAQPQGPGSKFQDLTGYYTVKIGPGVDLDTAMGAFARNRNVDHVEKIGIHPLFDACATGAKLSPNDTYYDNPPPTFNWPQWDLWDTWGIDADMAWSTETGDPGVVVVAMDSGTRYIHRDLGGPDPPGPSDNVTNGNIWVNAGEIPANGIDDDANGKVDDVVGWDFVTSASFCTSGEDCSGEDNDPRDFNGHGTHTAGTMAAITNNAGGVAGIAGGFGDGTSGSAGNGSKILICRIGWDSAFGGLVNMSFAAQAMDYVTNLKVNHGVNVVAVNASWGSSNSGGIDAAVDNLLAADIMLIHAAGNDGSSTPDYLGNKAGVMNVAATDQNGLKASFSNFGSWVDVAAPGVDIISTYHNNADPANDYVAVLSGTSMAAPHVAGVAALLESCNASLSGPDKFSIMVNNTCRPNSPDIGGLLNARLALDAAGCGGGGCTSDAECDDGLFCNGAETCNLGTGQCEAGTPPNCNDGVACTEDSCNEATDSCDNVPNDANCDDGLFCNGSETCDATLDCQAGTPVNCDDSVVCTDDSCNEATDSCDNVPNNANCDDGLFCNGAETCDALADCQAGSDPCPGQICDEATDTCNDCVGDADCDDGLFCNGAETCVGGTCQAGTAVNCDDGVACTDDSCNETTDSCDNVANDANCDDGLFCNGAETCSATLDCQAGTPVNCDDGVACTDDSCNETTDSCDNVANDANCDDGSVCTGSETCDPVLGCQAGTPLNCDDGEPCTTDTCDPVTGCENTWPACGTADGCCGPDCTSATDPDCAACDNDGLCETGEDCTSCPNDCFSGASGCGNGVCEPSLGEDCLSCSSDCNGKQNGNPSRRYCCGDGDGENPVGCGDVRCTSEGFDCSNTPVAATCCGDLFCEGTEDSCNCSVDCGAPPANEVPGSTCSDGLDNDCDGLTDGADPDCPACAAKNEPCLVNGDCCSGECKPNGRCR